MSFKERITTLVAVLGVLVGVVVLTPASSSAANEHALAMIEEQVIVTYKPQPGALQQAWGARHIDLLVQQDATTATDVLPLAVSSQSGESVLVTQVGSDPAALMEAFSLDPSVAYVQPNYRYHALFTPNDPQFAKQWNFTTVKAEGAWDMDQTPPVNGGDPSIVVAVLDTGVAYEDFGSFIKLPDFASTRFTAGYDFVNNDSHPNDDNGHGTHVTGTLAASTNNGAGAAGLAFQSSIMPIKILDATGGGSTAGIAQGVDFARVNGARVMNLSLGGVDDDPLLHTAVTAAKNAGILVVAATGNDADSPGYTPSLLYPASYADTIAVGATRFDDARSAYSNYGTGIDLMAPGGDLGVDQNGDSQPDGVLQETCANSGCTSFGPFFYEGTSQATPHVSAAVALLLSAGASASDIQDVLQSTATDLTTAGYDTKTGYGLLNIQAALAKVMGSTTAPSGSLTINGGAATTGQTTVSLALTASDTLGTVTEMSFSNDGSTFSAWEAYATTRTDWNMADPAAGGTAAEGTKTVLVRFRVGDGAASASVNDTIALDQTPPTGLAIKAWASSKRLRAILAGQRTASIEPAFTFSATDALSGVADYIVTLGSAESDPAAGGTAVDGAAYVAPAISSPGIYVLSVRARDQVGNASAVATFTFTCAPQGWVAVTGAGGRPRVTIYQADGSVVRTFPVFGANQRGGLSVATGDVDGDGVDEIVVGSGPGQPREARIYSFAGKLVRRIRVGDAKLADGVTVAVGNVRGDSALEIITGSVTGTTDVRIFSARGTLLKKFLAFSATDKTGVAVAVGDFQHKGTNEIAVARVSAASSVVRFFTGTGRRTKEIAIAGVRGTPGLTLGAGDIDADGVADLLVGEAAGAASRIHVVHRTGRQVGLFRPYAASYHGGVVAMASDVDGDGSDEIFSSPTNTGTKLIKSVTIQGKAEPGIRPVAPLTKTPPGGYRVASVFLPATP